MPEDSVHNQPIDVLRKFTLVTGRVAVAKNDERELFAVGPVIYDLFDSLSPNVRRTEYQAKRRQCEKPHPIQNLHYSLPNLSEANTSSVAAAGFQPDRILKFVNSRFRRQRLGSATRFVWSSIFSTHCRRSAS